MQTHRGSLLLVSPQQPFPTSLVSQSHLEGECGSFRGSSVARITAVAMDVSLFLGGKYIPLRLESAKFR